MGKNPVDQQATLLGLISLKDIEVAHMTDEEVKQMLMDLRQFDLVRLNNSQISGLAPDDACRMLLDARNLQRSRVRR